MAYVFYNPNPLNKHIGDCVIRAVAKATEQDWEHAYLDIVLQGYLMKDIPSSDYVWNAYLKKKGFTRTLLPDTCPDCYTVEDFCQDHPFGTYILKVNEHVVNAQNGDYFDTWDSGHEAIISYWEKR